jgi:hypothetical protein
MTTYDRHHWRRGAPAGDGLLGRDIGLLSVRALSSKRWSLR